MKKTNFSLILGIWALGLFEVFGVLGSISTVQAGVFNIPEFVEYHGWAVGIEPEATLSTWGNSAQSGIATTAKFTYGITPLSNLQIGMGTGSGTKGFRTGGTYTFDIIPNLDKQIGAGLALQAYYYKLKGSFGQTETTLYPYIHNTFHGETFDYDPYIALPWGMAFYNSNYRSIMQLVFGSYVKASEHFGLNAELGLNLKDTDTYISFGITYRD